MYNNFEYGFHDNQILVIICSASTKSALFSYPIAPHTMIPGVVKVFASIIASSCDLSPGRLRTRWRKSDCHKQKLRLNAEQHRMPLNVPVDSSSTPGVFKGPHAAIGRILFGPGWVFHKIQCVIKIEA